MKKAFLILILLISPFTLVQAAETSAETINARILPSIWYSNLSPAAGQTTEVHAGIQNNSGITFSGKAILYVDDVNVGEKAFSSDTDALRDVFVVWKATEGKHVFQIKVSASLPASKDLSSYKTDLSYMEVSTTPLTFSDVKDTVVDTTSSAASNFLAKGDEIAASIVKNLEAAKKETNTSSKTPDNATSATNKDNSVISSILNSNQAAAVYNTGIDVLAFLVNQWKWTLSVLVIAGLFLFLKSKAVF